MLSSICSKLNFCTTTRVVWMDQLIEPNTHRTIDCPYPDEETEVHDYDKSVYVCRAVSPRSAIKCPSRLTIEWEDWMDQS